ncbi:MAG: PD-(D/E)XK nuclease family protein [Hespellia sp.]|nr:PD-(D/E)XK nuclease family protein [Hespellia sp.]
MIIGTAEERRAYDKDPNLMSKSQFMALSRKKCQMPYKYRWKDEIEFEPEPGDPKIIGTMVHEAIEQLIKNLAEIPFNIYKHKGLDTWTPELDVKIISSFGNFLYHYNRITYGKYNLLPKYMEVVAQEGREIGTLDQVWEMEDGSLAVIEIKNSKFPSNLADIRIETAFYARLVGASHIGAFFLRESESRPNGGFFFEPLKPALEKRVEEHLEKAWTIRKSGDFKRVPTVLCAYCDYIDICREECTSAEKKELKKQLDLGKRIKKSNGW